jgi:hypothetical protein
MLRSSLTLATLALLLSGLTGLAVAQNVTIQLTPQGTPIQIPASGGSFDYIIAATNNGGTSQQATIWCMLTLPNGNPYGPVLGPVTVTLSPSQTIERLRTQAIPAGFPSGNYSFNAYIGVYPDSIWDSDSFPFEKLASQGGGTELWVTRYNGPQGGFDVAKALTVDDSGNFYATGHSVGIGTVWDFTTIKYNSAGQQQWVAHYNGPGNNADDAAALAVDDAGNVYVTGFSIGSGTSQDYATVKYNSSGVQLWVARYDGPGNRDDGAFALALDGAGNVYVTGYSNGSGTSQDYATIMYNSSGVQQWVARYNGPGNGSDIANALIVDGASNTIVTGESAGSGTSSDFCTIKYNSSGVQQWISRYNGPGNGVDIARDVIVDGSSNTIVIGESAGSGTSSDFCTIKYNSSGLQQWVSRYNGPGNGVDIARSVIVDGTSNTIVTGESAGSGTSSDFCTIKYNSSGVQQWVSRYNGPGNATDAANALALDGAGNVFVAGGSVGNRTNTDYATIKYNSSGAQQWVSRYNGPGNNVDVVNALAVDGTGDACVTGASLGSGTNLDWATIKYSGGNLDNWQPVEALVFGQPLPQECQLEGNFPNPFNATTVFRYKMPDARHICLGIYDISGRLVETLVDGWRSAGKHELTFDASDLPSGMYVYRIQAGDWSAGGKMVLVK